MGNKMNDRLVEQEAHEQDHADFETELREKQSGISSGYRPLDTDILPRHQFKNIDPGPSQIAHMEASNGAAESIKKIIDAIKAVDCRICVNGAAMMICKQELRKHL